MSDTATFRPASSLRTSRDDSAGRIGLRHRYVTPQAPYTNTEVPRMTQNNTPFAIDRGGINTATGPSKRGVKGNLIAAAAVSATLLTPMALAAPAYADETVGIPAVSSNAVSNDTVSSTGYEVAVDTDPATVADWMLTSTTSGASVDLSTIVSNPAFDTIDVDAALADLSGKLADTNSPVVLHTNTVSPGNTVSSSNAAVTPASSGVAVNNTGSNSAVVNAAYSAIGTPYVWGGTTTAGFDCSGFVQWAYAQAGKSIPRTSQAQASAGTPVAQSDMQPGDVIVYYSGASHVGIYVGNGKMIDSLSDGHTVTERPVNYMPIHSVVRF